MPAPPFASLADLLAGWSEDVLHGSTPVRWPAGSGLLARFPLGPGLVTMTGGPPGPARRRWRTSSCSTRCGSPRGCGRW